MFVLLFLWFAVNLYSGLIEPIFFADSSQFFYRPEYYDLEHYNQDLIYFDYLLPENLDPKPTPDLVIKPFPWTDAAGPMFGGAETYRMFWEANPASARSNYTEIEMVQRIMELNVMNKRTKRMFSSKELNSRRWTKLNEKWMNLWSDLDRLDKDTRDTILIMYVMFKRNGAWDHNFYAVLCLRLKKINEKYSNIFKK